MTESRLLCVFFACLYETVSIHWFTHFGPEPLLSCMIMPAHGAADVRRERAYISIKRDLGRNALRGNILRG